MYYVNVHYPTHTNIFPYQSEMGAIYFATTIVERANRNATRCPHIDVIDMNTGEVVWHNLPPEQATVPEGNKDISCKDCNNENNEEPNIPEDVRNSLERQGEADPTEYNKEYAHIAIKNGVCAFMDIPCSRCPERRYCQEHPSK